MRRNMKSTLTLGAFLKTLQGMQSLGKTSEAEILDFLRLCFTVPEGKAGDAALEDLASICGALVQRKFGFTEVWTSYDKLGKDVDNWTDNCVYIYKNTAAMTEPVYNDSRVKTLISNLLINYDFDGDFVSHDRNTGEYKSVQPYTCIKTVERSDRKIFLEEMDKAESTSKALYNAEYYLCMEAKRNLPQVVHYWMMPYMTYQMGKKTPFYNIEGCDLLALGGAYNIGNGINGAVHVGIEFCMIFKE